MKTNVEFLQPIYSGDIFILLIDFKKKKKKKEKREKTSTFELPKSNSVLALNYVI